MARSDLALVWKSVVSRQNRLALGEICLVAAEVTRRKTWLNPSKHPPPYVGGYGALYGSEDNSEVRNCKILALLWSATW